MTSKWRHLLQDKSTVELEDTPLTPFKELLRYLYTGRLSSGDYEPQMLSEVRQLAERYEMYELVEPLLKEEEIQISSDNVIQTYAEAPVKSVTGKTCLAYISHNTHDVFHLDEFYELDVDHLRAVFERPDLNANEQIVFEAIRRYICGIFEDFLLSFNQFCDHFDHRK